MLNGVLVTCQLQFGSLVMVERSSPQIGLCGFNTTMIITFRILSQNHIREEAKSDLRELFTAKTTVRHPQ